MTPSLPLFLLGTACSPAKIALDTAVLDRDIEAPDTSSITGLADSADTGGDSADTGGDSADTGGGDTGGTAETEPPRPEALWCLDFEDGTLEGAGYGAVDFVELYDGALVFSAAEGDDFSALSGEEAISFRGDRALAMRSNDAGEPDSVSIATSPVFVVEQPALFWWQLSEVDERGVYLGLDLISEAGAVLASAVLPPRTGGHVPGLKPGYAPVEGIPEIVVGDGIPGELVAQQIDVSAHIGQSVKLRFYQHTQIPGQGFFTLLDDICHGEPIEEAEAIATGEPVDHGA